METPDTPHWTKTPEWGNLHDLLESVHRNIHLKHLSVVNLSLVPSFFKCKVLNSLTT